MSTATFIAILIAIVAIAIAIWAILRMRNTTRLRSKFGPEYDHVVERAGGRTRAEAELTKREKRVNKFNIRELSPQERRHFADAWTKEQSRFVDDPRTAVLNADALVIELMTARGYPMSDFQPRPPTFQSTTLVWLRTTARPMTLPSYAAAVNRTLNRCAARWCITARYLKTCSARRS